MNNCKDNQNKNACCCQQEKPEHKGCDVDINVCGNSTKLLPMLQTYTTKVLQPNICCKKNILTQKMVNCEGYKYVIRWDFDLNGKTILVPENCILEFDGGTLSNGTIIGQDTYINDVGGLGVDTLFGEGITREGTWRMNEGGGSFEQVQSDWNETDSQSMAYIKNKPTIPSGGGDEDKPYDPDAHSGLGRKTLELGKDGSNVLTQEDFDRENTIYVIKYDFDLGGAEIQMPAGCVLDFRGGSLNNGSLKGETTIINMPKNLYDVVNCYKLYISNIEHLSTENLIDTYTRNRVHRPNRRGSKYIYSLEGVDKIHFTVGNNTQSSFFIILYDKDFNVLGDIWNLTYEYAIPANAVYASFGVSVWQSHIQEIDTYVSKMYSSLLDQPSVEYPDNYDNDRNYKGELIGILPVKLNEVSPVYIEGDKNSTYYNTCWYLSDSSNTTSLCIPYSILKDYDYIAIKPRTDSFARIYILKTEPTPTNPGTKVEFCDWYREGVRVNAGDYTAYLKIPEDARYVVIYCTYGNTSQEVINRTPRAVTLYTEDYLKINTLDNTKESVVDSISRNYIKSIDFVHWNIGNFSNGGSSTAINDSNYARKDSAFRKFINTECKTCNFLLNEFNPVFAKLNDGNTNIYTNSRLFWQFWHTKSFVRINDTDELAIYAQNNLVGYRTGHLTSLAGMYSESGGWYVYPKPYVLYRYFIGLGSLFILHTHLPTRLSVDQYRTVYAEMVSIMSTYSNVIILGDFNCSDRNALDVFTDAGYSIGNPIDSEPTHSSGVTVDWCVYRGNFSLTNFRVRTDAIDETAEDTSEDPRMLSDHWPISFTVTYNSTIVPSTKGASWYNEETGKPQWCDGEDIRDAEGNLVNIRRSGTTEQRPGSEQGTEPPANIGFCFIDTSFNPAKPVFWTGNGWSDDYEADKLKVKEVTGTTTAGGNIATNFVKEVEGVESGVNVVVVSAYTNMSDTIVMPFPSSNATEKGWNHWWFHITGLDGTPKTNTNVTVYIHYFETGLRG